MIRILFLSIGMIWGAAHAACDPNKLGELHWDPEAKKTCVPCGYEHYVTPAQKENEHCQKVKAEADRIYELQKRVRRLTKQLETINE